MEPISTNWSSISENGESSGSCIKQTCPPEKTFRTLELNAFPATLRLQLERLKSGAFLKESTNVIALGKPGVGKSHDLAAVAYELAHAGHSVLWTATSTQVQRLLAASTCAAWRVRT